MPNVPLRHAATMLVVLFVGIAVGRAQTRPEPLLPGYLHYTPADLDAIQRSLVPKMNAIKQSAEQLAALESGNL